MARRTKFVTIEGDPEKNRDVGKTYIITEVSAMQAEEWAVRAFMALGTSGIRIPDELMNAGLVGVALIGYQVFMGAQPEAVLPLWREMLPSCVQLRGVESAQGTQVALPWSPTIVEEVSTMMVLRQAILELHTGFTLAEAALRLKEAASAIQSNSSLT
jgi:hypothetical protein